MAADDEGNGCFGDWRLIPGDRAQPGFGFWRAYCDEAPVLYMEGGWRGGADLHQLTDLVVAQSGGWVVVLGGAATDDTFDDGIDHDGSYG
ncbi:hypothetical protein D3C85_1494140 [compost metagenome]